MTDNIKLPPFPEGMCLREDIEDYARAAVEADRAQRVLDADAGLAALSNERNPGGAMWIALVFVALVWGLVLWTARGEE